MGLFKEGIYFEYRLVYLIGHVEFRNNFRQLFAALELLMSVFDDEKKVWI